MTAVALTVAGSDPSGGAGLQADLKTFHQHGVYGMAVVTLLTVQNSLGVHHVDVCPPGLVSDQLDAVLADIPPRAIKTGALGSAAVVAAVAEALRHTTAPVVVDPVMVSTSGQCLLDADAIATLVTDLLPRAALMTPNLAEAALLAKRPIDGVSDMQAVARTLGERGTAAVLVTGGRRAERCVDVLWHDGALRAFDHPWIDSPHTHGTGCVLSAAITARLAQGQALHDAIRGAIAFVERAIRDNPGLGGGRGPLNLHVAP